MLFKILKLLAIPCALSVVLPFLDTYRIAALPAQEQTGYLLLALGAMLGFGAAGYLISWGLSRLDSILTIQRRRVYDGFFSAVFLAGLEFFLPWNGFISGLGNLLLGAAAVLSFLIAGHAYFQEYGEVFNRKILYRNLKIQVSCMVFFFVLRPFLFFLMAGGSAWIIPLPRRHGYCIFSVLIYRQPKRHRLSDAPRAI
ncbi:MAG: hypothetical protein ACLRVT_01525 [Oscillospiraceae bacterium]